MEAVGERGEGRGRKTRGEGYGGGEREEAVGERGEGSGRKTRGEG